MRLVYAFLISVLLANSGAAQQRITPDIATQRVLKQHGLESEILRSFDQLEAEAKRPDGLFEFILAGPPEVYLLLDRDYWILTAWDAEKGKKDSSYVLNPKDEQSALNITVEEGKKNRTGFDKSREPGFTEYSSREGLFSGSRVSWRRCSDSSHLYSEATVTLPFINGAKESVYTVHVDITANTEARRLALEDCLARLELRKSEAEKKKTKNTESRTSRYRQ